MSRKKRSGLRTNHFCGVDRCSIAASSCCFCLVFEYRHRLFICIFLHLLHRHSVATFQPRPGELSFHLGLQGNDRPIILEVVQVGALRVLVKRPYNLCCDALYSSADELQLSPGRPFLFPSFKRSFLGCVDADLCDQIPIGIRVQFEKEIKKKGMEYARD